MRWRNPHLLSSSRHGSCAQTLLVASRRRSIPAPHPISSPHTTIPRKQARRVSFPHYLRMLQEGELPDTVTLLSLLSSFSDGTDIIHGKLLHSAVAMATDLRSHLILGNAVISMYGRCDPTTLCARTAFHGLNGRNVSSWNAFISVLLRRGKHAPEASQVFEQMKQEGAVANSITFLVLLQMCADHSVLRLGLQIHACIAGVDPAHVDVMVNTALLDMYGKCGCLEEAELMFQSMLERNAISWNAMVSAYARAGESRLAVSLFSRMLQQSIMPTDVTFLTILMALSASNREEGMSRGKQMHARIAANPTLKSNISLGNALVGMYRRFGSLRAAIHAFDMMPMHDLVSWNTLISSCSQHQMLDEAFQSFSAMQCQGVIAPNKTTFSSILSTCASGATLFKGIQMHILAILNGLLSDLLVCNALISMYGKCGNLVKAQEVFDRMPEHNTISWNAIFDAYALNGEAVDIRYLYERMRADRASPDLITFTSILTICSRSGLVDDACNFLKSMHRDYGLMPTCDHFNCVIDLLGRTGKLDEAENILSSMPIPYGAVSVRALMSGCKNKSDLERGERAAKHVIVFDPENTGPYTMLTNLYNVTD